MPNTRKIKVCAICGKSEGSHWALHWKRYHPGAKMQELPLGGIPIEPYDESCFKLNEPSSLVENEATTAKM